MLRTRTTGGKTEVIVDGRFVEITDLSGDVAVVFAYDDKGGSIKAITAGSIEASRYATLFGVKFSKIVKLPGELK